MKSKADNVSASLQKHINEIDADSQRDETKLSIQDEADKITMTTAATIQTKADSISVSFQKHIDEMQSDMQYSTAPNVDKDNSNEVSPPQLYSNTLFMDVNIENIYDPSFHVPPNKTHHHITHKNDSHMPLHNHSHRDGKNDINQLPPPNQLRDYQYIYAVSINTFYKIKWNNKCTNFMDIFRVSLCHMANTCGIPMMDLYSIDEDHGVCPLTPKKFHNYDTIYNLMKDAIYNKVNDKSLWVRYDQGCHVEPS